MDNIANPNSQEQMPMQQPMPQGGAFMPPMPPKPRTWRERMMHRLGMDTVAELQVKKARTMPNWIVRASVFVFIMVFALCTIMFGYAMPVEYAIISTGSVFLFFYGAKSLLINKKNTQEGHILKYLFGWALGIRLVWVILSYFLFNQALYGKVDGYGDDNGFYLELSKSIAQWMEGNLKVSFSSISQDIPVDDTGYPTWLALLYVLSSDSSDVFIPLVVKAFLSAYSCVCIYRIARRHFDEGTARLACAFTCLNPNMLFWCSSMLKETEMVFLCCVCLDNVDKVLSAGKKVRLRGLLPGLLAAFALFTFRTALGIVVILAIFAQVVFSSNRVLSVGKKFFLGVLVALLLLIGVGNKLQMQSNVLLEQVRSGQQEANMEWRANRTDGGGRKQAFAKYAGAAVFAPLIFTIPFPTFNMANEAQIAQAILSGGNYIKNIFSFFVIIVMIMMLISGEWRRHVFILAYTLGYLMVLVMSNFAQSGRFHMPVWPMLMLFAAYGIQIAKGNTKLRRGFTWALVAEVFVCLAWNWFKLKGRGMI